MSDKERIAEERQRLAANPRYRLQHFVAWMCGEDTFRAYMDGDKHTRDYIHKNLWFLAALFEGEEFRGQSRR